MWMYTFYTDTDKSRLHSLSLPFWPHSDNGNDVYFSKEEKIRIIFRVTNKTYRNVSVYKYIINVLPWLNMLVAYVWKNPGIFGFKVFNRFIPIFHIFSKTLLYQNVVAKLERHANLFLWYFWIMCSLQFPHAFLHSFHRYYKSCHVKKISIRHE